MKESQGNPCYQHDLKIIYIYIYVYIVIYRQTVLLDHNASVWLDIWDASNWDQTRLTLPQSRYLTLEPQSFSTLVKEFFTYIDKIDGERHILRERNSSSHIFFREPGDANACPSLQTRQRRPLIGCVSLARLRFSALCPNLLYNMTVYSLTFYKEIYSDGVLSYFRRLLAWPSLLSSAPGTFFFSQMSLLDSGFDNKPMFSRFVNIFLKSKTYFSLHRTLSLVNFNYFELLKDQKKMMIDLCRRSRTLYLICYHFEWSKIKCFLRDWN